MAPKKLLPRTQQQSVPNPSDNSPHQDAVTANKPVTQSQTSPATRQLQGTGPSSQITQQSVPQQPQIPQQQIKQGSATSAQLALEAGKKAYELRQAAYAAGDPDAREEILGKAINKEIEAEAFGKAAKYTRSGAFQGLAAGAGLGIQPGAVIGQVTGAIVGGLLATVGGLLGGGIGSAYGAIKGPIWDIGAMASHGARGVLKDFIGDFPDFGKSTKHQKDMLEKMVLGAKNTPNPSQAELEQMKNDNGGASQESYQQMAQQMTSYLPSMPSMPDMSKMSQGMSEMPKHLPLVSSLQGLMGGQKSGSQSTKPTQSQPVTQNQPVKRSENTSSKATPSSKSQQSIPNQTRTSDSKPSPPESKPQNTSQQPKSANQNQSVASKENLSSQNSPSSKTKQTNSSSENPQNQKPTKKAPKLEVRSDKKPVSSANGEKKAPPKLEQRSKAKPVTA